MRDIPEIIVDSVVGFFVVLIFLFYYKNSIQQEETIQVMNDIVRTSAISNIDHASRVQEKELYLSKSDFEADVKNRLVGTNGNTFTNDTQYKFEYLADEKGSIKAVRLKLVSKGKKYQSTSIVSYSE